MLHSSLSRLTFFFFSAVQIVRFHENSISFSPSPPAVKCTVWLLMHILLFLSLSLSLSYCDVPLSVILNVIFSRFSFLLLMSGLHKF